MKDRVYQHFQGVDLNIFKTKMLNWANQFSISCLLDNNQYPSEYSKSDWILGVCQNPSLSFSLHPQTCFLDLQSLHQKYPDWWMGHFNFEANEKELVDHPIRFPVAHFFRPEHLFLLKNDTLTISSLSRTPLELFNEIQECFVSPPNEKTPQVNAVECIDTPEQFIQKIQAIQSHIQRGDCYEMNYCTAFYAENAVIEPLSFYQSLSASNPSPFAAYYRYFDQYLISASPERFMQKEGALLRSQPIKGTIKREMDAEKDQKQQEILLNSAKDHAENVMIVDLVRNDLSTVCKPGSVKVDELMHLYSFPFVHQLISTISGEMEQPSEWGAALQSCYPMGSMTGAPKKSVIALTKKFESQPRGIFSGSIGYIQPNADFDFNVVIRSVLYNAETQYICFPAGAGITIYSDAVSEWEECLLKIDNIKKMLAS